MELWSRSVWIELESRTFSEVYGCVWVLWEVMAVSEAVLEIEL